jgi:SAM-dependent methyltransferase
MGINRNDPQTDASNPASDPARAQTGFTSEDLARTLDRLDDAHNYAGWIADLITPHLGPYVLEVGAGIGSMSALIRPHTTTLVICEPHAASMSALQQRFGDDPAIRLWSHQVSELPDLPRTDETSNCESGFDAVVLVNVLEHIENDAEAIANLHRMLKPGGRLILFVPAFNALMSDFDRKIGHHRRYRRASLTTVLPEHQWQIHTMRYTNAPGFFLWWLGMRILRLSPATSPLTKLFDRYAVPVIRRIETRFAMPFGQSIFAVAHSRSPGP